MRVLSRRRYLGGGTRGARSPYGHEYNDMLERGGESGGTRGARSPYGYEQNAALRQEDSPVGRVPQGTRSPHGHEQNAALRQEDSPVGRAERVPPTGTRKSALRRWRNAVFFLMSALCCLFSYVRARASTARVWGSGGTRGARSPYGHSRNAALLEEGSPVGRAERVPPTGTRKSALRRWRGAVFFLMSALVRARRRVWGSGWTRPAGDAFPLRA